MANIFGKVYGATLYFITDGKYVKIGRANNTYKRLEQLQTGNPNFLWVYAEFKGKGEREAWVHRTLKEHRVNNEWYLLNDAVKAFVNSLKKE